MPDEVVLINAFEVPARDAETFIAAWEKTRDYLRTQPGYVDTALHRAITPETEFAFVNIARWRTAADFAAATSAKLPWFLAVIAGLSFVLLMLAFRSLLIPAITAVLNLLSAAASFGVLTAFFQWGWGTSAFGLGAASPIEGYLPGLVLAILFGLSMDYQVFLVSRMAEEWSRTHDNARSVLVGQAQTARVITAAAAIMIAVFITFVLMGQVDIAEFGIALAAAVTLDAFVLRTVLVPAVMHLCGRANWWLPRWLDRRLPHLAIEPPAPEQSARAPWSALV